MKRLNDAGIGSLADFLLEWHKRGGLILDCGLIDAWASDAESDSDGLVEIRARDSINGEPMTWTAEPGHWQADRC